MAPQMKKPHRPSDGSDNSGGFLGHAVKGPKMVGLPHGPNSLMEGVKGNRGMEKVLMGAGISEGNTDASKTDNRDGDGGSRLRMLSSLESMADPAWIYCSGLLVVCPGRQN